jgi:hypothetical protein
MKIKIEDLGRKVSIEPGDGEFAFFDYYKDHFEKLRKQIASTVQINVAVQKKICEKEGKEFVYDEALYDGKAREIVEKFIYSRRKEFNEEVIKSNKISALFDDDFNDNDVDNKFI